MTNASDRAQKLANDAASRRGDEGLTDAIGEGLAAIAWAITDAAAAVRETQSK